MRTAHIETGIKNEAESWQTFSEFDLNGKGVGPLSVR